VEGVCRDRAADVGWSGETLTAERPEWIPRQDFESYTNRGRNRFEMLLRWLVGNVVRQATEGVYQDAMSQAARLVAQTPGLSGDVKVPEECQLAVVFALSVESSGLVDKLSDPAAGRFRHSVERFGRWQHLPLRIVETGVGADRAIAAVEELRQRGEVAWIVSAGFAGSLVPELKRGDILMADSIVGQEGTSLDVGFRIDPQVISANPHLHVGKLVTVDHLVSRPEERRELASRHGAVACDMESAAIAEVCRRHQVRFLSVRIITDGLEDELPMEVEKLLQQKSTVARLGVAAGAIFQRPGAVKDLWKLREEASRASERLAGFLVGVLPQLPLPGASRTEPQ
jgi:adenosylhomocysteine nucleosidase